MQKSKWKAFPQKAYLALRGLTLVTSCQDEHGTVTAHALQALSLLSPAVSGLFLMWIPFPQR